MSEITELKNQDTEHKLEFNDENFERLKKIHAILVKWEQFSKETIKNATERNKKID